MIANKLSPRVLILPLLFWLAGPLGAAAAPLRDMTPADIATWKEIKDTQLTPDGAWLAYVLAPEDFSTQREAVAVLRSTRGDTERRFTAGDPKLGAGKLKVSGDGRWLAFIRVPVSTEAAKPSTPSKAPAAGPSAEKPTEKPAEKPVVKTSVVLVEVTSGKETVVANMRSFAFGGLKGEWIALQGYGPDPAGGSPLLIQRLGAQMPAPVGDVREFAFDREGKRIVWTTQTNDGAGNSVQVRELATEVGSVLDAVARATYQKISWSRDGQSLAVLREIKQDDKPQRALLAFTGIGKGAPARSEFGSQWAGFPADHEFDPTADLTWREDGRGLFFSVRPGQKTPDPKAPKVPDQLRLWHWESDKVPRQKAHIPAEKSFLGYVSFEKKRYVGLGDADSTVTPHARGRYVLGYSAQGKKGALQTALTGRSVRNYFLVELGSGKRTQIVDGVSGVLSFGFDPVLSPDCETVVYYLDGHYYAYDIAAGRARNLTEGLPPFYDEHRQRNLDKAMDYEVTKLVGWSRDGRYAVMSDHWDTWALPRRAGSSEKALRLTHDGRTRQVRYTYIHLESGEEKWQQYGSIARQNESESQRWIDLKKPMYFRAHAYLSQQTGYSRRASGSSSLQQLAWDDADLSDFRKARDADVVVYTRQTGTTFPDYHVTNLDFATPRKVTDANPLQRELHWSAGTRMLNYKNEHGETRRATLWLPADYQQGKAYPTIVMIYEEVADRFNRYRAPSLHGSVYPNYPEYAQQGYALLLPDIIPKADNAGPSAVTDVLAGVKAAVATGVVDQDRLGLTGQSYGGFETAFVITQTNIFKAAAAIDILSDLVSHSLQTYAHVDGPPGGFMTSIYLANQVYMTKPWWENPEAYTRSSAIYYAKNVQTPLLIRQNDRDLATTFFQGVEYFTILRAMGKPVVMLQYTGADHADNAARPEDGDDLARREREFFDHFLKGAPAPKWWTEGVP